MPKILAIDDKQDNLIVIQAVLKTMLPEAVVLTSQSGSAGIEVAQREHPDVILLDLFMPDLDGYAVCASLKADPITQTIPVIILTALKTEAATRIKALEIGADAFLSKPIDEAELVAQIRAMLRIKHAEDRLRGEKDTLEKFVQERTQSLVQEITIRTHAEEQIRAALREKTVLVREIYHRTKNNMTVICAMLGLQADNANDARLSALLSDVRQRIHSMALVHEQLYAMQDLSYLDLQTYTETLVYSVLGGYQGSSKRISLQLDLESLRVSIETAIPYGQILNELLTNAMKHAFPNERAGHIRIALRRVEPEQDMLELCVSDNGIGFPPDLNIRDTPSFGLQIVTLLAENQLKGDLTVQRDRGTTFTVRFHELHYPPRV